MDNTDFLANISKLQNEYYSENGKNMVFKKGQKLACASNVADEVGIDELLDRTVFIIPNTKKIFIDYTIFKLYSTPENSTTFINRVCDVYEESIRRFGYIEVHINFNTVTVSAVERYKTILQQYFLVSNCRPTIYYDFLTKLYVYNIPSFFEMVIQIARPFLRPEAIKKLVTYDKNRGDEELRKLFAHLDP